MSSNDILIVGGSGFIGTRLSDRLLAAGHKVRIYDKLPRTAHPKLSIPGDIRKALGRSRSPNLRIPRTVGLALGSGFDLLARIIGRSFPISRIRVEKFCANTRFDSSRILESGFSPEVDIRDALHRTVVAEFGCGRR